jgi:hypothetical protein
MKVERSALREETKGIKKSPGEKRPKRKRKTKGLPFKNLLLILMRYTPRTGAVRVKLADE